ncbi:hypothetical protein TNCV_389851 [Trichonephila clavipes]|nr:hypothetical protein TNCV_389851 [Trichonephila clavipes]
MLLRRDLLDRTPDELIPRRLNRRFYLDIWTVKQSSIPYRESLKMLGMAKVVFSILLSGMTAIGRTMESGRRGYGASRGKQLI